MESQKVGPWTLIRELGHGGNATVWLPTRPETEGPVALKVLNSRKVRREPYQRFIREIRFLRQHGALRGILPLIDAYLPEDLTTQQTWLAMPVATPIRQALTDRPLEDIVSAIAAIADTL